MKRTLSLTMALLMLLLLLAAPGLAEQSAGNITPFAATRTNQMTQKWSFDVAGWNKSDDTRATLTVCLALDLYDVIGDGALVGAMLLNNDSYIGVTESLIAVYGYYEDKFVKLIYIPEMMTATYQIDTDGNLLTHSADQVSEVIRSAVAGACDSVEKNNRESIAKVMGMLVQGGSQ